MADNRGLADVVVEVGQEGPENQEETPYLGDCPEKTPVEDYQQKPSEVNNGPFYFS